MPCLNEEATLASCIKDALKFFTRKGIRGEIIVVDNGSTDRSVKIAKQNGARVVLEKRHGYGRALRTGIKAAQGKYIIMGDCDRSYDFAHMSRMWKAMRHSDLVVGNRFTDKLEPGAMSKAYQIGVKVLSWLGRKRYRTDVYDFHCGLRGMRRSAIKHLKFKTTGMEFATEMIALAARRWLRIRQVPIRYRKSGDGRVSKLRVVRDDFRHLDYILLGGFSSFWQKFIRFALILLASVITGLGLLWNAAQIPQEKLRDHELESAEYFLAHDSMQPNLIEDQDNTKRDFYADSIWLSIAYGYDGSLKSVISSKYADVEDESSGVSLQKQLNGELEANTEYSRYWHGALIFMRPLLTVMNVRQIYVLNTVIIVALMLLIIVMLIMHREYRGAGIYIMTMIAMLAFFAGTSLEYSYAVILMELVSIASLILTWKGKRRVLPYLFFFSGILVNYLDFMTAETITLTVPLLLSLWLQRGRKMSLASFKKTLHLIFFWLIGYVLMWAAKWFIALIALGGGTLGALGNQMGQRSFKAEMGLSIFEMLGQVFKLNIGSLFPFCLDEGFAMVCMIAIILAIILNLYNMQQNLRGVWVLSVLAVGLVPILRSLIMIEHEWQHFFFTYRAFGASLMAILMIIFAASVRHKRA